MKTTPAPHKPNEAPRVRVLLATRNGAAWLPELLNSLSAQEGVTVDLIARDDASTDNTVEILNSKRDLNTKLIIAPTPSGGAAQNFFELIITPQADSADYYALCDQDDIWHPNKLIIAIKSILANNANCYSGGVNAFWQDGRRKKISQRTQQTQADFLFEGAGQGCTFVFTAQAFLQLREQLILHPPPKGEIHYHDWLLYAMARSLELAWFIDPNPTLEYRQHTNNDTGAKYSTAGVKSRLRKTLDGWYGHQVRHIANYLVQALPERSTQANTWDKIHTQTKSTLVPVRLQKFAFIIRNGRRSLLERTYTAALALLGKL